MNTLEAFTMIAASFVGGMLALWAAVFSGKVELKKRKPETIVHRCRLADLDVYTFIKGDKKQTPPLCSYLDSSGYISCQFEPSGDKPDIVKMHRVNNGKCYIACFNDKFDLI